MKNVKIVGIGPGHPDYLLPAATKALKVASVVIGGSRQLEAVAELNDNTWLLERNYPETVEYIKEHWETEDIAVAVSGDSGFYSLLNYLKRNLPGVPLNVIPGISSLQYLYAKAGLSWESSRWLSAHGREPDFSPFTVGGCSLGILTDAVWNPAVICGELCRMGAGDSIVVIGENLSYPQERIRVGMAKTFCDEIDFDMNAMILLNPEDSVSIVR